MQRTDRWGLDTTATTADALLRLEQLIDDFVTFDAELPSDDLPIGASSLCADVENSPIEIHS